MPRRSEVIAGLDIGSGMTRLAVAQVLVSVASPDSGELHLVATAEAPSGGIHRGTINSIEDVVSSVSAVLESAERMAGSPIDAVWVGISGMHVMSQTSHGVIAVSKADGEISDDDVGRAIEASRAIAAPLNYEVLHVMPKSFSIDGQAGIKDPVGMTGIRLEVDTQIILGSSAHLKNLTKAIYRTGLEIEEVVLGSIATAEAVLTPRQKELGVAIVNVGASTTSVAIFEEGELLRVATIPLGSEHITNDLAIGLRTSIDIAEAVKVTYGDCSPDSVSKREQIDLYEVGGPEHEIVKKDYVRDIIQARAEEILRKVNAEFAAAGRSGLLPAGVVFTGGGAKVAGLVELSKKALRLPTSLGYPLNIGSVTDKVNDLAYATSIGLVKWGYHAATRQYGSRFMGAASRGRSLLGSRGKISDQVRKWVKNLIP